VKAFARRALVDLAQAAYATESDDAAWLARLHASADRLLDTGMGSIGYFVDAGAQRIAGIVGDELLAGAVVPMHAAHGAGAFDVYFQPRATSLKRFYGGTQDARIGEFLGPTAGDIWGITCVDARGRGVVLTAPQGTRRTLPLGTRAWTMAAVHIATAWRMRTRADRGVEAVLSKTGKLLHREPSAEGSEKALAAAVVRRGEALRGASSVGSEAALAAWRSLTDGRWSIVEAVESDGKRYLVARRNELDTPDAPTALTDLERQVCAMAAAAHSQKLIAYELGIHPSAVVRNLASGMAKLGVSSVAVLARRFAWLPTTWKK
jgi:DNA-binding CsgD family transcriptional regulator